MYDISVFLCFVRCHAVCKSKALGCMFVLCLCLYSFEDENVSCVHGGACMQASQLGEKLSNCLYNFDTHSTFECLSFSCRVAPSSAVCNHPSLVGGPSVHASPSIRRVVCVSCL